MRASTAYFAGAGTVLAAIVGGIGGGLLFADMISPQGPKQEMTKLEQRMSSQPIQVKADPEPVTNPAAPPPPTTAVAPAAPAQTEAAKAAPTAPPAETTAVARSVPPAIKSEAPPSQPAAQPKQAAAPEDSPAKAKPEDSLAKAKDTDIKRAAVEKRKVDRRQQWSERRRNVQRQDQGLLAFEEKVREETEARPAFAAEPAGAEMPRIRLFGLD